MRARFLLLAFCVCVLLLALQPQLADAKKKKSKAPKPQSTPAPAGSSPPTSARDDDPVIRAVRGLRNKAMQAMDKKEYAKSVEMIREAITKMHDRVFGESRQTITDPKEQSMDAASYAQLLNDYGTVLIRDEQYEEAVDVLEDASTMMKKIYGDSHPSYGLAMRSLADAYMAKKEFRQAIDKYKTLRHHVKLGLGVTHEAYMEASLRIAEGYKQLGDIKRAIKVYKKVIKDQDGQVNMETKGMAEIFMELAMAQNQLNGDIDDAIQNAEAARAMFKEREGEESLNYAFSLNALAGVKMRQHKIQEAYELLHQAHTIALRLFGKDHKMVQASAKTLKDVKTKMDELRAAAATKAADDAAKDEL